MDVNIETINIAASHKAKEAAAILGVSVTTVYNYRYIIKKCGGIDNMLQKMRSGKSFYAIMVEVVPERRTKKRKTASSKTIKEKPNTIENESVSEPLSLDKVSEFLNSSGLAEHVKNVIARHMVNVVELDKYVAKVCERMHTSNLLDDMKFYSKPESRLTTMVDKIMDEFPYKPKLKIKEVIKEIEKPVNVLDKIYTSSKIIKEYPRFFLTEKQVANFIKMNLGELGSHVMAIPRTDEFILDEDGAIILLDLAEKIEKEDGPLDNVLALSSPVVQQELKFSKDLLDEATVKIEKKVVSDSDLDADNPLIEIKDNLVDDSVKWGLSLRKVKAIYNMDKAFFDALLALRADVTTNEFYEYCNNPVSYGQKTYLIKEKDGNIYWVLKKMDFDKIVTDHYKKNNNGNGNIDLFKVHDSLKAKNMLDKYSGCKDAIVLNWTRIKKFIEGKQGFLNAIPHLK